MKWFIFVCILFCGVSGHSEITQGSISNASVSASEGIHTAKELLDIKNELASWKKGKKRPRRFTNSEITQGSLSNASTSASEGIHTAKELLDIKNELASWKKGKKRPRRFTNSEITQGSLSNASTSASEGIHTAKELLDIKNELASWKRNKVSPGKKRSRRFTKSVADYDITAAINKVEGALSAFFNSYVYQPIAHGKFTENTVRGYSMMGLDEGKFIFGTLDGELNQSFRSIWENRHPRTGDIISCRIATSRRAEHYMLVLNNRIAEVAVVGGKSTHNGVLLLDSYRKSTYINSTECLHHKNRLIEEAEQFDEREGDDSESERWYKEILLRIECTLSNNNSGQFHYTKSTCNSQDLVLYWAYGYVETYCLKNAFNACSEYYTHSLYQISRYVDVSGHLQKNADDNYTGGYLKISG